MRLETRVALSIGFLLGVLCLSGRIVEAAPSGWWNPSWQHSQWITLTAGSAAVPSGYSVSITFNHAGLVTSNKSRADGDDIRIAHWNGSTWVELDRFLDPGSSWNTATTTVWFKLQAGIAASSFDDNYGLYYGNSGAGAPPVNTDNVFLFYDGFESGDVGAWDTTIIDPGDTLGTTGAPVHTGSFAGQSDVDGTDPGQASVRDDFAATQGFASTMWVQFPAGYNFNTDTSLMQFYGGIWGEQQVTLSVENTTRTVFVWNNVFPEAYFGTTTINTGQWYRLEMKSLVSPTVGRVEVWVEGVREVNEFNRNTGTVNVDNNLVGIYWKNSGPNTVYFDDVSNRLWVDPEPGAALGAENTLNPGACSTMTPIGSGEDQAFDMVVQPDGRFILVGYSHNGSDEDIALVRYLPDGRLDPSFDGDGIRTDDVGASNERVRAVALQTDGKIVVAGFTDAPGNEDWFVARYDTDGSLDPSFSGGIVTTAITGLQDRAAAIAIQSDGKIVVSGYGRPSGDDIAVVRYNADGSLDGGFGTGGIAITDVATTDRTNDVKIQPDGKIVVGGSTTIVGDKAFLIIRYGSNGTPDPSFGTGGVTTTQVSANSDTGEALAIQPNGDILFGGFYFDGTDEDFVIARYRGADGLLDPTFGTGGIVTTDFSGNNDNADDLLLQPDSKILVAGYAHNGTDLDFAVARYHSDGSLDGSFGTGGLVTAPIGFFDDNAEASALLPDGGFIVAGFSNNGSNSDFSWTRHSSDGGVVGACGVVNYRSIGTAANYTDGTGVTATNGSTVVTGVLTSWRTSNRGRGDLITIDGVPYTVLSVDSETQLTLTSPYTETTGSGRAYTIARKFGTLQAWEDCIDATTVVLPFCHDVYTPDLTVDDRSEIGVAYADTDFTDHVLIQGAGTDADRFITLTADAGNQHNGVANGGVLLDPSSTDAHAIDIRTDYTRVEWLEITGWEGNSREAVHIDAELTEYEFLLIHGGPETNDSEQDGIYLESTTGNYTATIRNTIVYRVPRAGILLQNFSGTEVLTLNVENVTLYNNGIVGADFQRGGLTNRGEAGTSATINAKNVLSVGNTNNDFTTIGPAASWGSSDSNLDSDLTAPGTNPVPSSVGAVMFVSTVLNSEDLHIQPTSSAENVGADLSGSFTLDIDGGTRPAGQWDIGADEESATASSVSLANHPSGQVGNKFTGASPITDTLFQFRLTRFGTGTVDAVRVEFTTLGGVSNSEVTNGELWEDSNGNGTWDDSGGGDTSLEGSVTPSGGTLTFNNDFSPGVGGTDYFVRATVSNLVAGNATVFSLDTSGIDELETGVAELGSASNALHSQSSSPSVNYRSIGTHSGILYQSGNATIMAGSTVVTFGGGASLPVPTETGAVGQGDRLVIGSETFFILSRYSATQAAVQEAAVSDHVGEAYTITRAYNTLQAWEDDCVAVPGCLPTSGGGRGGDLVSDDRYEIGVAYNDVASGAFIDNDLDGSVVRIEGSAVDPTRHRDLTVAVGQRHNGTAGTGAVVDGQSATAFPVWVRESDTRVEWLEIKNGYDPGDGGSSSVYVASATNVLLEYLLVYDYTAGNSNAGARPGSLSGTDSFTVRNSIFYNGDYAVRSAQAGDSVTVENCSSYGMSQRGYSASGGGAMSVTNSIAMQSNLAEDFGPSLTGDYNLDEDGTAPGANSISGTPIDQFVSITPGSEDLHLKASADAIDAADPTPLAFCCDIDGATRIGIWDIGADEGGAAGCCELQVTEGAGTITVTAPGSFEMRFNEATGGGMDRFFDLAEDPSRTVDLAGGTSEVKTLFHVSLFDGSTFYTTSTNDAGAQVDLLEVTPTRVRLRQNTFFQDQTGSTILAGARGFGDHSIYPGGRLALSWNLKTTAMVSYQDQGLELGVHYSSVGGNRLNNWTAHRELGATFGVPPNSFGDDDFVMLENDSVGARTDFLQILYRDWVTPTYLEDADYSDFFQNGGNEYAFVNWRHVGATSLPVDSDQTWYFLSFFKPTNFVDNTDPAVTGRVDDYRPRTLCPTCGPDDLATPVAPTAGDGWFHTSENTAGPSDFFNESEAAYALDFDMSSGLTFDIDGGLGTPGTPIRYSPFFKIRQWRSLQDPDNVTLEGTALTIETDFKADVKPLSRVYAGQDPIWYSTLQETTAISPPDIGSVGIIMGTPTYVAARYGQGARFDGPSDVIRFGSTGMDVTRGTVEFWVQPEFNHTDGVRHTFWFNLGSVGDFFQLEKTAADALEFSINNGTLTSVSISSANYSWRNKDWVHIRATWREAASPGSQLQLYVNGSEPTHTDSGTYTSTDLTVGNNYIGNHSGGSFPAIAVIDEFVLYKGNHQPSMRAYAGLTSHPDEYMATPTRNLTFALYPADGDGRTDYFYFGSDSQFRGLNITLETAGAGTPLLKWEYWNGTAWADLDTLGTFEDETHSLTEMSGTVYWEEDPPGWQPYSVAGGPDLYYVRLHALLGSNYTTLPKEALIKTDILLFQYCGDITAAAQTFSFAVPPPTAVELVSFEAQGLDQKVELTWKTGSEIDNLGFHLYRATSGEGPFERITSVPIPGLGSSPQGKQYSYLDSGLTNGATYYYKLEDIETTGKTEMHGPVWATPHVEEDPSGEESPTGDETPKDETESESNVIGHPELNRLNVLAEKPNELVLELLTEGFYATPQEDGTVRLEIPDFVLAEEEGHPSLPVKRTWVTILAGRNVKLASVEAFEKEVFEDLRPEAAGAPVVEASARGTVGLRRGSGSAAFAFEEKRWFYPEEWARVLETAYQQEVKKALVELAPLRWDETGQQLVLAHRLVVRVVFQGQDGAEMASRRRARREKGSAQPVRQNVVARLVTQEAGLYGVSFERVPKRSRRAAVRTGSLRLSRQGQTVPFYLQPEPDVFGPGTTLYFVSEGAEANRYGLDAVYELEVGVEGERMESREASPGGEPTPYYWEVVSREENHLYQAALVKAPDRWLWSALYAPAAESYPFEVSGLAVSAETAKISVWLQGATDFPEDPDHHVRLAVNGNLVGEASWNGKQPKRVDAELGEDLLRDGENLLELENLGDTGARYSMVMLNRFEVSYPRRLEAVEGTLAGDWSLSGTAEVSGLGPQTIVVEKASEKDFIWLEGVEATAPGIRFRAEGDRSYLAVSPEAVLRPEVRMPLKSALKQTDHRVDYLMIGSREFIEAAGSLAEHRESQGLRVKAVSVEEVFSEFGFGEENPQAIRDFLSYAYHQWEKAPRYVLLLGDATFDFKDYLGSGVLNQVPPMMVATSYLETASDPAYAAVNGEDLLPDLAIGRLPASTVEELGIMVSKIVSWETSGGGLEGRAVLVADNPDGAGDFTAKAEELAETLLSNRELEKIYLSELGPSSTRAKIIQAFDEGSSLMSYIGHGGIDLWASENIFNTDDVQLLSPQIEQPLLLTMNCLNGYFHFPYINALAEEVLKAKGKGVVAAFSPSGLSVNSAAHIFHRLLLEELVNGGHTRLGDAVLAAQSAYVDSGALPEMIAIYHLLGDPALQLSPQ